jgi:hypothetical protein
VVIVAEPTSLNKLKLNNEFKPLSVDEDDELYPNGIFEFNITKLLIFIKANPASFSVEGVELQSLQIHTSRNLDEGTIETASLSVPILFAEISPGMFNVIDGNHRVERACRAGIDKLPVYRIYANQHLAFLTSVKAYKSYIEYWNSKVDERSGVKA